MQDLYTLIGIDRSAQAEDIAFAIEQRIVEEQAKQDQGDPDAATALFNLREARHILLDPNRRAHYNARLSEPSPQIASLNAQDQQATTHTPTPTPQNALGACKACGGTVSKSAKACPHCGQPAPTVTPLQAWDRLVAVVVVFFLVWWGIHSWSHREPPTMAERIKAFAEEHKNDKPATPEKQPIQLRQNQVRQPSPPSTIDALSACQVMVKHKFKAPSSADFTIDHKASDLGSGRFLIISYVEAINSYGAKLRTKFSCQVKHMGGSTGDMRNWNEELIMFDN